MSIFFHSNDSREELHRIEHKLNNIMATQAEEVVILQGVLAQQKKTVIEIAGVQTAVNVLNQKIIDLQAIIDGNAGTAGAASPELVQAVADVAAQAQVVDEAIPDAPVIPTPAAKA